MNAGALQASAVALGAAIGGVLRWRVGFALNQPGAGLPLGTLLVNCLGGLVIGFALVALERWPNEAARLFVVTGLLGGFTTFSAFSAESLLMLRDGRLALAFGHTLAHVLGALGAAALGFGIGRAVLT